jgi:phosphoribosylamine---glycine ligase
MKYSTDSKLADKLLIPLTSYLHSINYRGFFDMAAIVDEGGTPWPLEATSRPGWPCEIIAQALHVGDPAQWMLDLLNGEDTLEVLDEIAIGVVVTIGDYPFTQYTKRDFSGYPVYDTEPLLLEDIHLCEVKLGKAPDDEGNLVPTPVTCGDYVLVATGTDYSVKGAQMRANRAMKKVEIPLSPGWRDDIGERIKDQLPRLREHDYVPDWKY